MVKKPSKSNSGQGTIRQRESGRWQVQLLLGGRRLTATCDSEDECHAWVAKQKRLHQGVSGRAASKLTLTDMIGEFLGLASVKGLRPTTMDQYEWAAGYVRHSFPNLKVVDIRASQLDVLYAKLVKEKNLAPKSVRNVHGFIRAVLNQAVKWDVIDTNPAYKATPPKVVKREMEVWSAKEMVGFLKAIEGERLAAAFWVALSCGLRKGELLALKWEDVDLETGLVHIRRTVARLSKKNPLRPGGGLYLGPPKSEMGNRVVALSPAVLQKVKDWQKQQAFETEWAGSGWVTSGHVFTTAISTIIDPRNFERTFKALLAKTGVPPIRVHDLRHSCATALLDASENPKAVQELLGHATFATTTDLYGHKIRGSERKVATTMAGILGL